MSFDAIIRRCAFVEKPFLILLMTFPCVVYLYIAIKYTLNLPFFDDFSVTLAPLNWMLHASLKHEWAMASYLWRPMNGHIPFITHVIALWQVKVFGVINFKWSTVVGDSGLVITVALLIVYLHKKEKMPLWSLVPIPFFLATITHWEAMDFMVPAWQFYWGACLLPVLFFIAVIEIRWFLATLLFAAAICLSSGSVVIYPMAIVFLAMRKQWKACWAFGVLAGLFFMYFIKNLPIDMVDRKLPSITFVLSYISAFMGNIISNGMWDLQPYAIAHRTIGVFVIGLGFYFIWKVKDAFLIKNIFVYVFLLSLMAVFMRGKGYSYVPPRYSLFAMMALMCIYCLYIKGLLSANSKLSRLRCTVLFSTFLLLWFYNLYKGTEPLALNRKNRGEAAMQYINTRDKSFLSVLIWDLDLGVLELGRSKQSGVYDIDVFTYIPLD